MIVRVSLAPRARGVTPQQLQAHWRQHHADAAARLPGLQAYVQSQYNGPALASQRQMIIPERLALAFMRRRILDDREPPASAVKLMTLLRARPDTPDGELENALTGSYRDAVATSSPVRHELLLLEPAAHHGRARLAFEAVDTLWFATTEHALEHATGDCAVAADWELSGVVFGSERLLARPHRIV